MNDERQGEDVPTDRQTPVGEPVIRGDPSFVGAHAREAVEFDPNDPESLRRAAETVESFATETAGYSDNIVMLRGAAACAALVRGEGSYTAAAERAGPEVTVSFVRKWSRVHDLPRPVRAHVARGNIAPSAAKHVARLSGRARLQLAWAIIDHDITVREIRSVVSDVDEGLTVSEALDRRGIELGELSVQLPEELYGELRRRVSLAEETPSEVLANLLADHFDRDDSPAPDG